MLADARIFPRSHHAPPLLKCAQQSRKLRRLPLRRVRALRTRADASTAKADADTVAKGSFSRPRFDVKRQRIGAACRMPRMVHRWRRRRPGYCMPVVEVPGLPDLPKPPWLVCQASVTWTWVGALACVPVCPCFHVRACVGYASLV